MNFTNYTIVSTVDPSSSSSSSTTVASENQALTITVAVVSVLLGVSELLGVMKRVGFNGILDGIIQFWHKKKNNSSETTKASNEQQEDHDLESGVSHLTQGLDTLTRIK